MIREFDERIGLTRDFAAVLNDPRDPKKFDHSFLDMSRSILWFSEVRVVVDR